MFPGLGLGPSISGLGMFAESAGLGLMYGVLVT